LKTALELHQYTHLLFYIINYLNMPLGFLHGLL
jgi:hypothetical protein